MVLNVHPGPDVVMDKEKGRDALGESRWQDRLSR